MTDIHQQRIRETLHVLGKIQPQELAPILAHYYTTLSFAVARQQLQQLADAFSCISVTVAGFVIDADWQRREEDSTKHHQEAIRKATGPQGEILLSVKQVAEQLGVNKQKVYSMIASKELPATNINANTNKRPLLRVRATDVLG
ncbi:helix-turn-helix domain-containing protein [Hymenobacter sp. BRD67]|uniref:helix-turn-helix domain-containing protein n=1 Tax=Hymenobacter sp. BRD67 TaxID=2675877 RepID=UPI00156526A1|nr:helix-turn-helix domain-containing protein [Hymenobacter sp. BRD67]QKG52250.1 helix-turn-helix domain-containing protein [Hymenobacter sp. BRD67]